MHRDGICPIDPCASGSHWRVVGESDPWLAAMVWQEYETYYHVMTVSCAHQVITGSQDVCLRILRHVRQRVPQPASMASSLETPSVEARSSFLLHSLAPWDQAKYKWNPSVASSIPDCMLVTAAVFDLVQFWRSPDSVHIRHQDVKAHVCKGLNQMNLLSTLHIQVNLLSTPQGTALAIRR